MEAGGVCAICRSGRRRRSDDVAGELLEQTMTPSRILIGFVAGFVSVLTFQSGFLAILPAAGLVPFAPWNMTPVPPFGVPQTLSGAFWGGLWGIVYMLL